MNPRLVIPRFRNVAFIVVGIAFTVVGIAFALQGYTIVTSAYPIDVVQVHGDSATLDKSDWGPAPCVLLRVPGWGEAPNISSATLDIEKWSVDFDSNFDESIITRTDLIVTFDLTKLIPKVESFRSSAYFGAVKNPTVAFMLNFSSRRNRGLVYNVLAKCPSVMEAEAEWDTFNFNFGTARLNQIDIPDDNDVEPYFSVTKTILPNMTGNDILWSFPWSNPPPFMSSFDAFPKTAIVFKPEKIHEWSGAQMRIYFEFARDVEKHVPVGIYPQLIALIASTGGLFTAVSGLFAFLFVRKRAYTDAELDDMELTLRGFQDRAAVLLPR